MKNYSLRNEKIKYIQAIATSLEDHLTEVFENGYEQGYADGDSEQEYEDIKQACYENGLNDAWELVKRIESVPRDGGLTNKQIGEVFGECWSAASLYRQFSALEALDLYKRWEEKHKAQEIKVGDIVTVYDTQNKDSYQALVTDIDADRGLWIIEDGGASTVIEPNTYIGDDVERIITPTGRSVDMDKILKQVRGEA